MPTQWRSAKPKLPAKTDQQTSTKPQKPQQNCINRDTAPSNSTTSPQNQSTSIAQSSQGIIQGNMKYGQNCNELFRESKQSVDVTKPDGSNFFVSQDTGNVPRHHVSVNLSNPSDFSLEQLSNAQVFTNDNISIHLIEQLSSTVLANAFQQSLQHLGGSLNLEAIE